MQLSVSRLRGPDEEAAAEVVEEHLGEVPPVRLEVVQLVHVGQVVVFVALERLDHHEFFRQLLDLLAGQHDLPVGDQEIW